MLGMKFWQMRGLVQNMKEAFAAGKKRADAADVDDGAGGIQHFFLKIEFKRMIVRMVNNKMSEEELKPFRAFVVGGMRQLYFHWPKTDELFTLEDKWLHGRLNMFGTFRTIRVERDDLRLAGTMEELKKKGYMFMPM